MTLTDPPSDALAILKKIKRYTLRGIGPLTALRWAVGFHHFVLKEFRLFSDLQFNSQCFKIQTNENDLTLMVNQRT